jgi:hypothetical protein
MFKMQDARSALLWVNIFHLRDSYIQAYILTFKPSIPGILGRKEDAISEGHDNVGEDAAQGATRVSIWVQ